MSTDDSEEYHVYTRRETLQGAGTGAAAVSMPLSYAATTEEDDGWLSGLFSSDPDFVVTDAEGNIVSKDPDELRVAGSAVTSVEEVGHPDDTIVRLTVDGGEGVWTETADGAVTPANDQPVHLDQLNSEVLYAQSDATPTEIESLIENNPAKNIILDNPTIDSTVDVDLGNTRGLTLGGKFTIGASGITNALRIQNGRDIYIPGLKVDGNGHGDYKFIRDFAENTTGLDSVLYFRGTRNVTLDYQLYNYNGRGLEIKTENAGEPKTSKFTILNLKTNPCAQTFHIDTANAFGQIDGAFIADSQDGSYLDSQDVSIAYLEGNVASDGNPMQFKGATYHTDRVLLAGGASPHLQIIDVSDFEITDGFVTGGQASGATGVELIDCDRPDAWFRTAACDGGPGVTLDGCKWGDVAVRSEGDKRGVLVTSATTRECEKLTVDAEVYHADERAVSIEDGGNGTHTAVTLQGLSQQANQSGAAGESDVMVDAAGHEVNLRDFDIESSNTAHYVDAPAGNSVRAFGGSFVGSVSVANRLELARDVRGWKLFESNREPDVVPIGSGDSTGDVTVTVSHNLAFKPQGEDIDVDLVGASASDYSAYVKELRGFSASSFDVIVHIDSLASTTGETVDLSWKADVRRSP